MISNNDAYNNFLTEELSSENLEELVNMVLNLWPNCIYEEEYAYFKNVLSKPDRTCFLLRTKKQYIAFIYLSIRSGYFEGAQTSKVAYIEGIYVHPVFRKRKLGTHLLQIGEQWGKDQGSTEFASDTEIENLIYSVHLE